jgi:uncharacterized protein with PIN domain
MNKAYFHFLGDLNHFLRTHDPGRETEIAFRGNQSLKHLIESLEIPHTEIGDIYSLECDLELGYIVQDGDHITVSPAINPVDNARFLLDNHLGKLATYLRILGFDTYYQNYLQDDDLIDLIQRDARILLTRDRQLLMRKVVKQGYCVRSLDPEIQAHEVLRRFRLRQYITPFHRCLLCNSLLQTAEKEQLLPQLQPLTRQYFDEFRVCPNCNQIYWKGSHYDHMLGLIKRITERLDT